MTYTDWEALIVARLNQPAPMRIELTGNYSPTGDSGTVFLKIYNDSTASVTGRVIIAITEDSLLYVAPNGTMIHNNVPRDYLPDDSGTTVSIGAGDSVTVTQPITTNASWVDQNLNLLAWVQNDVMQPDSTKEIWQGAVVKLVEIGIAEKREQPANNDLQVHTQPNPCVHRVDFIFSRLISDAYAIRIFDLTGREIKSFSGMGTSQGQRLTWNLQDHSGARVAAGIYLYRFENGGLTSLGKIIVQ